MKISANGFNAIASFCDPRCLSSCFPADPLLRIQPRAAAAAAAGGRGHRHRAECFVPQRRAHPDRHAAATSASVVSSGRAMRPAGLTSATIVSLAPGVFITASDYQFVAGLPFREQPRAGARRPDRQRRLAWCRGGGHCRSHHRRRMHRRSRCRGHQGSSCRLHRRRSARPGHWRKGTITNETSS